MKLNYFKLSEFDSPDLKGSGVNMDAAFLKKLDKARGLAGITFNITSGYRTKEYNSMLNDAVLNSSHIYGLAADIEAISSRYRFKILKSLITVGFHRIGVSENFIHVDDDISKVHSVVWLYG